MMGMAYSRLGRHRASVRVLNLAVRLFPDSHVPLAILALEHEALADRALGSSSWEIAAREYAAAAAHHRKAAGMIEGGLDQLADADAGESERAREKWCLEQLAALPKVTKGSGQAG
jgi:hypothetical protein